MELAVGVILAILMVIFMSYSLLMIKHAARFRYLSSRTVYMTVTYAAITTILVILAIISYLIFALN